MNMILRKAQRTELPAIMEIIHQAQRSLAEQGVDQWQDGYPDEAAILRDMENGYCHVVVEAPAGKLTSDMSCYILGVAALIPDGEPDYDKIYDGAWLGEGDYGYMTVHRVAVNEAAKRKGVASFILSEASRIAQEQGLSALRLDTHRDNRRMQACLERNGLTRCGIIHLGRENLSPKAAEKQETQNLEKVDKTRSDEIKREEEVEEAYIRFAYEKML